MAEGEIMANIIECKNVSFCFASEDGFETKVLDDISLSVAEGEFVSILGHNGSGKSTLAKHLNGVYVPTQGKVYIDGMDTSDEDKILDIRRKVGMVFQNPDNQIVATIVEEDVAFGPENLGMSSDEIRRRVDGALATVGLSEYAKHASYKLSGGQKQRLAIAGILAMTPKCIVLDEPTAMLDPVGRAEVIKIITQLNKKLGITVVLITHYMNEVVGSDRLIIMDGGKIRLQGTPKEVFSNIDVIRSCGLEVPQAAELMAELGETQDIPLDAGECADRIIKMKGLDV